MDIRLDDIDARVLGSLIEKALTTPEYYPLTLNSLTNACNQKSNRSPVMGLQKTEVVRSLDRLRDHHLAFEVFVAGSRVPKYEHRLTEKWELLPSQVAVLCILLLRGPQTAGEIRSRTGRMFSFSDLGEVEATLESLRDHKEGGFVIRLPRQPGYKESRFMHLLCGKLRLEDVRVSPKLEAATVQVRAENERIKALEERVESLQADLQTLSDEFEAFKAQFD
jgi:uncharacterized protein YceH (UPF0502 family)